MYIYNTNCFIKRVFLCFFSTTVTLWIRLVRCTVRDGSYRSQAYSLTSSQPTRTGQRLFQRTDGCPAPGSRYWRMLGAPRWPGKDPGWRGLQLAAERIMGVWECAENGRKKHAAKQKPSGRHGGRANRQRLSCAHAHRQIRAFCAVRAIFFHFSLTLFLSLT